jgi:hypothetical protein
MEVFVVVVLWLLLGWVVARFIGAAAALRDEREKPGDR